MDGRVRPDRIAKVLREIDADIIALQEVLSRQEAGHKHDHAGYVAEELGYHAGLGETRRHRGAAYGNLLLTRFPIHTTQNYDITALGRERRGCLRADLQLDDGALLHVFNVHMGTAYFERRRQARKLMDAAILTNDDLTGARLVLGDFNEWTRGLASRLLRSHFHAADPRAHLGRTRTYPGLLPLLHLDHIYFDPALKLESLTLHRSRTALVASDHLPFVADFSLPASRHGSAL
jgi:endonuclease/exonuclease/phosphatase family metal-dependent hydrolase